MPRINGRAKLVSDKSLYIKTVLRGHELTLDRLLRHYDNQLSSYCNEIDQEIYILETYNEEILPKYHKVPEKCLQNAR